MLKLNIPGAAISQIKSLRLLRAVSELMYLNLAAPGVIYIAVLLYIKPELPVFHNAF